ncbi:MAG TPA: hypothetical protein VFB84_08420 [Micromonosporaceae bacterium]|nr:hypothetical protein [Micromonosporaceae bacterium]
MARAEGRAERTYAYLGLTLVVPPDVQPITGVSRAMTTFFRQAGRHLAPGGRMLIFFGTSGDLAYLRRLAGEEGFAVTVVAQEHLVRDGWRVDYLTFRMTLG